MTAPGHLLIVEDDECLRRIVGRYLRARGFEVDEAGSAEEVERSVAAGLRPAAVVLDPNLPGKTGWELLRGPTLAAAGSPSVVIVSATAVRPRLLAQFGVAGYLPKPFALETLVSAIERCLESPASEQPS